MVTNLRRACAIATLDGSDITLDGVGHLVKAVDQFLMSSISMNDDILAVASRYGERAQTHTGTVLAELALEMLFAMALASDDS